MNPDMLRGKTEQRRTGAWHGSKQPDEPTSVKLPRKRLAAGFVRGSMASQRQRWGTRARLQYAFKVWTLYPPAAKRYRWSFGPGGGPFAPFPSWRAAPAACPGHGDATEDYPASGGSFPLHSHSRSRCSFDVGSIILLHSRNSRGFMGGLLYAPAGRRQITQALAPEGKRR